MVALVGPNGSGKTTLLNLTVGLVLPTTGPVACYHDGMAKKVTTVRMPEELADKVEVVARGRGVSVNALVVDALIAEIERVSKDEQFMSRLRELTERDKEILDRLAE